MYLSARQRTWLCVLSICSAITAAGLIYIGYFVVWKQYFTTLAPCDTEACVNALCQIRSKMDQTVDPCTDFYQFACGNYEKQTELPEDKVLINVFSHFGDKVIKQIADLLERTDEDSSATNSTFKREENRPFRLAKILYGNCKNVSDIESRGVEPHLELMEQFGGWPILKGTQWDERTWDLFGTIVAMRKVGIASKFIMKTAIDINLNETTKRILYFDSPDTTVHANFLQNGWEDPYVQNYLTYISDLYELFGGNKTPAAIEEMKEIIQFEIDLTRIIISREYRRNPQMLFNILRIKDMQKRFPYIDWLTFIQQLYPTVANITRDEPIAITDVNFFAQFGKLVRSTPKRILANYLMWRLTTMAAPYLTSKFRAAETKYHVLFYGEYKQQARWQECVAMVLNELPVAAGAMYARAYFDPRAKTEAIHMVNQIKEEFEEILMKATWMDPITRMSAIKKLHVMQAFVGYPEELRMDEKLNEYYRELSISKGDLFYSVLNNSRFLLEKYATALREPVVKSDWKLLANVADINAYYDAAENKMRIPAGIFQDHFFGSDRPKYLNYGAIGFVIGHEITHGYDDLGGRFDMHGNLNNWWQNATKETYTEKTKCIIEQYSNYTDPTKGIKLNGITTLGENIADNGGIKIAYRAYKNWVMENAQEQPLFSLNYTPEQLFWINNAQTWCSLYRKEALTSLFKIGTLTPGKWRVHGYLQNNLDFSRDFNCPAGSPMNPLKKCEVW